MNAYARDLAINHKCFLTSIWKYKHFERNLIMWNVSILVIKFIEQVVCKYFSNLRNDFCRTFIYWKSQWYEFGRNLLFKYNVMSKIIFSTFNESEPEVECEQSTIDVAEIWYYLKNIVNVQNNIQYVQWKPWKSKNNHNWNKQCMSPGLFFDFLS